MVTGLQDGVRVQVEGEVERMMELLLSHSVLLGRIQSQCVTTEKPLSLLLLLSLSLSLFLITHFLVQRVSQASVLYLQLLMMLL